MDPFAELFGFRQMPQRELRRQGLGSGVVISDDGYILTNNHVVAEADSILVRFSDGKTKSAKVVGADPNTDVAVIKVDANSLLPIRIGDSDNLQVGEMVMAVGSPLNPNLAHTVTQGIVSAKGRSNVGLADYEDFIQTDAAINPGNSGGALVNLDGELVGINAAIASQNGGFQGIGFAVPINMAIRVKDQLIAGGKVTRGYLGVNIQDVNDQLAQAMKLQGNQGALIGNVADNSPASRAGLQSGDVVVAFNGQIIENSSQLRSQIASTAPGTAVTLTVQREQSEQDFKVTLGELESSASIAGGSISKLLGFTVGQIDRSLVDKYDLTARQGIVVTEIDEESGAAQAGLREGDLIRSVNRNRIATVKDFDDAVRGLKEGDRLLLSIERQEGGFFLAFEL
jgi:serine protease Do